MKRQMRIAFTLLELLVTLGAIALLAALLVGAVQKTREAAARSVCQNNLKQLALALHGFHDAYKFLPPGQTWQNGTAPLAMSGWEMHLLPFIDQDGMYQQALLDYQRTIFPDQSHRGLATVVPLFICPGDDRLRIPQYSVSDQATIAFTSYLGVCGTDCVTHDGVLYQDSQTRFEEITDGLSNTLLLGERPPSPDFHFGWWYCGLGQQVTGSADMILGAEEQILDPITAGSPCGAGYYLFGPSNFTDPCGAYHFWSPHPAGANFAFGDGSVRFISYDVARNLMVALATRAGGETVIVP